MAFLWIIEAQEQIEERGFSTSRWTDKSHHGSTWNLKSHILELVRRWRRCFWWLVVVSEFLKEQQKNVYLFFFRWKMVPEGFFCHVVPKEKDLQKTSNPLREGSICMYLSSIATRMFTQPFLVKLGVFQRKYSDIMISLSQNVKTQISSASSVSSNLSRINLIWSWKVPSFPSFSAAESKSSP